MTMPFSPCPDTGPCQDQSFLMLKEIFGDAVAALATNVDPGTVAASTNILATMFSYFNSGILIVGALIVSYVTAFGTISTANDGEALGKDWSSLWTPLRMVSGGAVLLPTASGYSYIQLVVLMISLWGAGLANTTYRAGMTLAVLSPNAAVAGVNKPGEYYSMREPAKEYVRAAYCARLANKVFVGMLSAPSVELQAVPNKVVEGADQFVSYYYWRDTNTSSNLGGGSPICGSITVNQTKQDDPGSSQLDHAMTLLRFNLGWQKLGVISNMTNELNAWVNSWPLPGEDGWNNGATIRAHEFNDIVKRAEDNLVARMMAENEGYGAPLKTTLTTYLNSLTDEGWASAGGWWQRVGRLRGQIYDVIKSSPTTITGPSLTNLPDDYRSGLLIGSLNGVTDLVFKRAEELDAGFQSYSNPMAMSNLSTMLPKDNQTDVNLSVLREDLDGKMGSFATNTMQYVVDVALGTDGSHGTSPPILCGDAGAMGGSINRMKCVGDVMTSVDTSITAGIVILKTTAAGTRVIAGVASSVKGLGFGLDADKVTTPLWDWILSVPVELLMEMKKLAAWLGFYFGVFLPSLPYAIFMIAVVGWILAVAQTLVAAPLWAVMHMTPHRSFIGGQTQGYLLLLSLFVRPVLAIIGLFAAMLVSDPVITYIAKGFFEMKAAVVTSTGVAGAIADWQSFGWWLSAFGALLLPVLYMIFGLPQVLPDAVLKWIGVGIESLGSTNATGEMRHALASSAANAQTRSLRLPNSSGGPKQLPGPQGGHGGSQSHPNRDSARRGTETVNSGGQGSVDAQSERMLIDPDSGRPGRDGKNARSTDSTVTTRQTNPPSSDDSGAASTTRERSAEKVESHNRADENTGNSGSRSSRRTNGADAVSVGEGVQHSESATEPRAAGHADVRGAAEVDLPSESTDSRTAPAVDGNAPIGQRDPGLTPSSFDDIGDK